MGKVVSLAKAKKRRDKKYDPYKANPLNKKINKALSVPTYKDSIELTEKGEIKLDEAGKPIFKDIIEFETTTGEINAIWTCIKACLEEKVVPPNEIDACFDLMAIIAKLERESTKPFKASLPINYFVGTWHILNSARMFHLFEDDKALDQAIDGLTMKFARQIDVYHEIKRRETVEKDVSPKNILSLPSAVYYPEDEKPDNQADQITE